MSNTRSNDPLQEAQIVTIKGFADKNLPGNLRSKWNEVKDLQPNIIGEPTQDFDSSYDVFRGSLVIRRADGQGLESERADYNREVLAVRAALKGEIVPGGIHSDYEWSSLWTLCGVAKVDVRTSAPVTNPTDQFGIAISGHVSQVFHAHNEVWQPGTYLKMKVPPVSPAKRAQWENSLVSDGQTFRLEDQRPTLVAWSPFSHVDAISEMRNAFWTSRKIEAHSFSELEPDFASALTDEEAIPMSEARALIFAAWAMICVLEDARLVSLNENLTNDLDLYEKFKKATTLVSRVGLQTDLTPFSPDQQKNRLLRRIRLAGHLGLHSGGFSSKQDSLVISRMMGAVLYDDINMPLAGKHFFSVSSLLFNSENTQVPGTPENTLAKLQTFAMKDYLTRLRRAQFQDCCTVAGKTTELSQPGQFCEVLLTGL